MPFAVGVFDLIGYAAPGALYLGVIGYLADRWGWAELDGASASRLGPVLLLALASYLLGHLAYRPAQIVCDDWIGRKRRSDPVERFRAAHPNLADRAFLTAKPYLLEPEIHRINPAVGAEISRLRAVRVMLRTATPAMLLGALVAAVELAVGEHDRLLCAAVTALLLLASSTAHIRSRRVRLWTLALILEAAAWTPGADELAAGRPPTRADTTD